MKADEPADDRPVLDDDNPPEDISREKAAYHRARPRLARDHVGKIAVFHGDDLVGVYDTFNEAVIDSCTRLGRARMIYVEITPLDDPDYVSPADLKHPSCKRLD